MNTFKNILTLLLSKVHSTFKSYYRHKDDELFLIKFKHYVDVMIVAIVFGNLSYLIKEIFKPTIYLPLLASIRLSTTFVGFFFLAFRNNSRFYRYSSQLMSMICGISIMISVVFVPDPINKHSCDGEILYYMIAGLSLAPVFFSWLAHLIGLVSVVSFSYLLYLASLSDYVLNPEIPIRVMSTGIISYYLGLVIALSIYDAYYKDNLLEIKLKKSLIIDPLCQIYNRFWIQNHEKISNCILGVVDVDSFKQINDTFGHDVGDIVLASNTRIISELLRDTESIARFGGDEFILILDRNRNIKEFQERVNEKLGIFYAKKKYKSTVSIGFTFISNEITIEEGMKMADNYLYELKRKKHKEDC